MVFKLPFKDICGDFGYAKIPSTMFFYQGVRPMNPPKRTAIPISKSKPPIILSRAVWYGVAALFGASLGYITLLTSWLFFAPTADSISSAGPRPILKPSFVVKDADMILGKLTKISEAFWKFEDAYKRCSTACRTCRPKNNAALRSTPKANHPKYRRENLDLNFRLFRSRRCS